MVGKIRSGLANDRRAYGCCAQPCTIVLANIATFGTYDDYGSPGWLLNDDTTITRCQILEIPAGQTLLPYGHTLTNNGTINVRGILRDTLEGTPYAPGWDVRASIIINNGTVNVFPNATITVSTDGDNSELGLDAIFTNYGVVNNYGDIFSQTGGVINNSAGGRINNYSTYSEGSGSGGLRINAYGTFNNAGTFINKTSATILLTGGGNAGIVNNNYGATFVNHGLITIGSLSTSGGIINNYSISFTNNGTISISHSGTFANVWDLSNTGPILTNSGSINIIVSSGTLINERAQLINNTGGAITSVGTISNSEATINNNTGGAITNNLTGTITNTVGGTIIIEDGATIDGTGAIFNEDNSIILNLGTITITGSTGGIQNSSMIFVCGGTINLNLTDNAGILNNGTICVYQNGLITGLATARIFNNSTISVADGSGSCGTGSITTVQMVDGGGGTVDTSCP